MDQAENAAPLRKNCPVCGEGIALKARKCIHCDSLLDWQRHLNFSSTFLALLVALISVTTVAVPIFVAAFEVKKSIITMDMISTAGESIGVLVTNKGDRPGLISSGYLTLPPGGGIPIVEFETFPPLIIEARETKVVVMRIDHTFFNNIWPAIRKSNPRHIAKYGRRNEFEMGWIPVTLVIPTRDFNGSWHDLKKSVYLSCGANNCQLVDSKPGF